MSLSARASRMALPQRRGPTMSDRSAEKEKKPPKQEPQVIQAAWNRFRIKICWLIRYTQAKHFLTTMLGQEVFLNTYQGLRRSSARRQSTPVTRVIQGKVVGKPKTPSETVKPTVSAKDCLHQEQYMKWRGNKHAAWWTCLACGSRWEGHTLGKFTPMDEPEGSELVLFGKHAGKTFQWVANNVPSTWSGW